MNSLNSLLKTLILGGVLIFGGLWYVSTHLPSFSLGSLTNWVHNLDWNSGSSTTKNNVTEIKILRAKPQLLAIRASMDVQVKLTMRREEDNFLGLCSRIYNGSLTATGQIQTILPLKAQEIHGNTVTVRMSQVRFQSVPNNLATAKTVKVGHHDCVAKYFTDTVKDMVKLSPVGLIMLVTGGSTTDHELSPDGFAFSQKVMTNAKCLQLQEPKIRRLITKSYRMEYGKETKVIFDPTSRLQYSIYAKPLPAVKDVKYTLGPGVCKAPKIDKAAPKL